MPRFFLVGIKVEGFRGINNEGDPLAIKFKKDKINSIFARNGVGKSSLFDAIHYAITGTLPKLDDLHLAERSEDYYVNRFHTQSKGTVELLFQSDDARPQSHTIIVERLADGTRNVTSPTGYANPEELLASFNSSFALLDYNTFNSFIGNSPLERGRSFSTLLGLDVYSDFRQAIKSAADTRALNTDLNIPVIDARARLQNDNASAAIVKAGNTYKLILGKDMGEADRLGEYSQEILKSLQQVPLLESELEVANLDEVDFEQLIKVIKAAEGGKDKDRFLELTRLITQLSALGSPLSGSH